MRRRALLATAAGTLACGGAQAVARPWFNVTGHSGHGLPALGAQHGEALLIRRAAGQPPRLWRMPWAESSGDRPATQVDGAVQLITVADNASDPMVPVRDGPFWNDPARWLLWREGAVFHALSTTLQRQTLRLPAAPAAVLPPALQRAGGPIDLLVLAAGGRAVKQLRFARSAQGLAQELAQTVLPVPAGAGCAAFGPTGGLAWGLWARQAEDTLLLVHDGLRLRQLVLPDLQPLSPPAMVGEGGQLFLAVVMLGQDGLQLVEACFPAANEPASSTRLRLGLSSPLRAAGLVYRSWDGAARALHGLLILADGSHRQFDGQTATTTAFDPGAPPVLPLSLVPTAEGAMVLCADPQRGPVMVAL